MTPPVLSIVGRSNAGKTTLLEKLIAALVRRGVRVGTIKHSHHQPDMDTPGKDSWRHKEAGASASLLIGPKRMLMVRDVEGDMNPRLLAERYFPGFDLLLVEGYAALPGAKIEVMRSERSTQLRCNPDELLAVVTDMPPIHPELPQFELDDIQGLSEFVLNWMRHD